MADESMERAMLAKDKEQERPAPVVEVLPKPNLAAQRRLTDFS